MTNTNHSTKPGGSRRHWQAHVKALQQSGLSRAEYCREHNLSYHSLSYWCKKTTKSQEPSISTSNLVPVPFSVGRASLPNNKECSGLRLCLVSGITIEVDNNFSHATLHNLLSVIDQRP